MNCFVSLVCVGDSFFLLKFVFACFVGGASGWQDSVKPVGDVGPDSLRIVLFVWGAAVVEPVYSVFARVVVLVPLIVTGLARVVL